jgi:hypothetical protein
MFFGVIFSKPLNPDAASGGPGIALRRTSAIILRNKMILRLPASFFPKLILSK